MASKNNKEKLRDSNRGCDDNDHYQITKPKTKSGRYFQHHFFKYFCTYKLIREIFVFLYIKVCVLCGCSFIFFYIKLKNLQFTL